MTQPDTSSQGSEPTRDSDELAAYVEQLRTRLWDIHEGDAADREADRVDDVQYNRENPLDRSHD